MTNHKIQINVKNERDDTPSSSYPLNILFTADECSGPAQEKINKSLPLSQFPSLIADSVKGGRIYIGCGKLPSKTESGLHGGDQPDPTSKQYFGWIEFSCFGSDDSVFINLSNVDQTALPLTLSGIDQKGKPWRVGYKVNNLALLDKLKKVANESAQIIAHTETGKITKVLAPNKKPAAYPSYDSYLKSLIDASAKVTSTSDVADPKVGPILFRGNFHSPETKYNYILTLKGSNGMYFRLKQDQFVTTYLYQCDGGTLYYAKAKDLSYEENCFPQNDKNPAHKERNIYNSLFRNLCIGINEGYFTPTGENNTVNFCLHIPFASGNGNPYAKILYHNTNSYGFPYADSNLKVLMNSQLGVPIEMTILPDDKAADYNADAENQSNYPLISQYHMAFGAGSDVGGSVTIENCRYVKSENYSGFLPIVSEWTKIVFNNPDHYIWFKTDGSVPLEKSVVYGDYAMGFVSSTTNGVNNYTFASITEATFADKSAPPKPS